MSWIRFPLQIPHLSPRVSSSWTSESVQYQPLSSENIQTTLDALSTCSWLIFSSQCSLCGAWVHHTSKPETQTSSFSLPWSSSASLLGLKFWGFTLTSSSRLCCLISSPLGRRMSLHWPLSCAVTWMTWLKSKPETLKCLFIPAIKRQQALHFHCKSFHGASTPAEPIAPLPPPTEEPFLRDLLTTASQVSAPNIHREASNLFLSSPQVGLAVSEGPPGNFPSYPSHRQSSAAAHSMWVSVSRNPDKKRASRLLFYK